MVLVKYTYQRKGAMKLFKKKVVETEKPVENKEPRVFYLDFLRKMGKINENHNRTLDETLAWLFPRKISDLKMVKNGKTVAMDSAGIKIPMYSNDLPEEMLPFFTHTFIGWQACALLYENAYIKKACEIPARDAVAVDYKLQYENGDDDNNSTDGKEEQEILNKLKKISDKEMLIKDICRNADIFRKVYGQILVVPTFNVDMTKVMEKPYSPSKIKKGTYTGMTLIQPFWVTYQMSADGIMNPQMSGYYEPEYYVINGSQKIHKSWIVKLITGVCPDILKPVYYYGGIPLTQQIFERVFCAEKTANEAPKLALTKRLLIVDGNVNDMSANPEIAYNALQSVLEVRDNMGVMVKNPGDQVQQIDTSLTDMDALIMTQFQLVAAIAEMPVTKLMKTQLKGLSNSGDYEMKDYAQSLVEIQENVFNRILERHYQILSMSEYGEDKGIIPVWNKIDTPTELEQAQIETQQAQTDSTYIASGVVSAEEVRSGLRANEDSRFHNLSDEMPEMPDMEMGEESDTDNKDTQDEYEIVTDEEIEEALDENEEQIAYMFNLVPDNGEDDE